MRLAIIADWLTTSGGAEQVIHEFTLLYPEAPLFASVARDDFFPKSAGKHVTTSHMQWLYRLAKRHQPLLSWMPRAVEDLDVRGYDVLLSSSHAVGKGIIPPPRTLHVCYCHTPMRYAWEMEEEYLHDFGVPKVFHSLAKRILRTMRRWDLATAKRVDLFFANSTTTQERIQRIYARESIVIPPPVGDRFFEVALRAGNIGLSDYPNIGENSRPDTPIFRYSDTPSSSYFLAVGRFVPYKRFDLLIQLANELKLPLKIAGKGQDEAKLRAMAGPTVEFLGFVPDDQLPSLYAYADAFFFPQFEDAGLVLLEAQACGTPVIAFKKGGALDAVKDEETGIFFEEQTVESMKAAIEKFQKKTWDRTAIRDHAKAFSRERFKERIGQAIEKTYQSFRAAHP